MERTLSFSVASVVEDVLQQHGNRLGNGGGGLDLESRRAEEAGNSAFSNLLFFPNLWSLVNLMNESGNRFTDVGFSKRESAYACILDIHS